MKWLPESQIISWYWESQFLKYLFYCILYLFESNRIKRDLLGVVEWCYLYVYLYLCFRKTNVNPKIWDMENSTMTTSQLIADSYVSYHSQVYLYILHKVNCQKEAEDLSQDVFLRLMEYKQMLRPDTVKFFIYTISRNLVNDYLRRYYKKQEITSYMYDRTEVVHNEVESCVVADDLLACEKRRVELLPLQRRKIYVMSRFEDKSVTDISEELNLSRRTVENHLFISRKEVREYLKQCI